MFAVNNTESKPGCWMYKQGNFITGAGFFPSPIVNNLDANVGAFFFPGETASDHPSRVEATSPRCSAARTRTPSS